MKLVMLGDSITAGENGHGFVDHPEAYFIQQALNMPTTNLGHGGGAIIGTQSKDLPAVVESTDFSQYDLVTIGYGVNDFDGDPNSLRDLTDTLNEQIQLIYADNPEILLIGILPIWGNTDQIKAQTSAAGYSWTDFQNALADVYTGNGALVLDWRSNPVVTPDSVDQTLADHWLHPNQETYEALGNRIASFIRDMGLVLIEYDGVPGHLKDNLNQNFTTLNQRLSLFAETLGALVGQIDLVTSDRLGREFRTQMLSGLETAIGMVNQLMFVAGERSNVLPLPIQLTLDDSFTATLNKIWNTFNRCLFQLQKLDQD